MLLTTSSLALSWSVFMAKRILNRKELRSDYDAAERRKDEDEEVDEAEDENDEDEEEEASGVEEGAAEEEEEPEEKPKKKKAAPKTTKPKAKPRSRAVKITRMRVVWGVFNNSNQCVATFEYPKRKDADAHAVKLTADKKNTHFVQPVKEPIETKKDE
jgi:hypothetical protein